MPIGKKISGQIIKIVNKIKVLNSTKGKVTIFDGIWEINFRSGSQWYIYFSVSRNYYGKKNLDIKAPEYAKDGAVLIWDLMAIIRLVIALFLTILL